MKNQSYSQIFTYPQLQKEGNQSFEAIVDFKDIHQDPYRMIGFVVFPE